MTRPLWGMLPRMRDGPWRAAIKAVARLTYMANLRVMRAWLRRRGQLPWELGGTCQGCGECCDAPAIQVGALTWYFPTLRRAFVAWQRVVNGMELTSTHRAGRLFIFRCTHFDAATRRCDSYDTRPGMCRDYPRILLHQAHPEFMPGCGHRPVLRGSHRMLQVLDGAALTPEQRRALEERLHLK